MKRIAGLALAAALAARASGAPDESEAVQACRTAFKEMRNCADPWIAALRKKDGAALVAADAEGDAAARRFRAAFVRVPLVSWDQQKDEVIFNSGLNALINDARARGDVDAARKWAEEFIALASSKSAFRTRGVVLPELDLAAGDLDRALAGFAVGVRQRADERQPERVLDARWRLGDVKAALGDLVGARADWVEATKFVESLTSRDAYTNSLRDAGRADVDARALVGEPLPSLPEASWIGAPPTVRPGGVTVTYFTGLGVSGDAGRLRELDRLARDAAQNGVDVRILTAEDQVGRRVFADGDVYVRIPGGPTDGDGIASLRGERTPAELVALIRERLEIRLPIGIVATRDPAKPPFNGTLLLIADRSGKVIHASASVWETDWACGLVRIVLSGKRPKPAPPPTAPLPSPPPTAEQEAKWRATCTSNLAVLAGRFDKCVMALRLEQIEQSLRSQDWSFWELAVRGDEARLLLCPAMPAAPDPAVYADRYLHVVERCSYAGPDLVMRNVVKESPHAVVGACLHHRGGALIARANGKVEFLTLKDLGLASEAEKTVGPDSKSPLLRGLR